MTFSYVCVLIRPQPKGMASGAVLRQAAGAGRHAAPQCSLCWRSGHPEKPAAGGQLQTVGGSNNISEIVWVFSDRVELQVERQDSQINDR